MFEDKEIDNKNIPIADTTDKFNTADIERETSGRLFGIIPWNRSIKIIFLLITIIILAVGIFWAIQNLNFSWLNKKPSPKAPVEVPIEGDLPGDYGLPVNPDLPNAKDTGDGNGIYDVEYISFADFYKEPQTDYNFTVSDYSLPLNTKVDVVNYYTISRKINLDPILDNLDNDGYGFLPNLAGSSNNDFYSVYRWLQQKEIPVAITTDFVLYYYQYNLKKLFKDVEASVFYDNLWEINKALYEKAKLRYESHLRDSGTINDPVLEGKRLAMAYLAVSLEILKPASTQINSDPTNNTSAKFSSQEAFAFNFNIPNYLKDDVVREVKFIREHKDKTKSPVLLYEINYRDFVVPSEYQSNARLNNFYLTAKWLNSVFPLYSTSNNCEKCLLDKDDWRVNMIASQYLAQDFSLDSKVKSKWARIYKIISFFKGLRSDLTYIHYRDAAKEVFGEDYNIDETFQLTNSEIDYKLTLLQDKISQNQFLPVQGGYSLSDPDNYSKTGLKILADYFWPNNYLFSELIHPKTGNYELDKGNPFTSCVNNKKLIRCQGFGLDIINLVHSVDRDNEYWDENTSYANYEPLSLSLKRQIDRDNPWQENNFWSNLNIFKYSFNSNNGLVPVFSQKKTWEIKENNTALGSWVNFQLPKDSLSLYSNYVSKNKAGLSDIASADMYNYIEPNLSLYDSLLSNIDMISEMFIALKINQEVNSTVFTLANLEDDLKMLKYLAQKQLEGNVLNTDEADFLFEFSRRNIIKKDVNNSISITGYKNSWIAKLAGVKLLALIREYQGEPILTLGPVFDYKEN